MSCFLPTPLLSTLSTQGPLERLTLMGIWPCPVQCSLWGGVSRGPGGGGTEHGCGACLPFIFKLSRPVGVGNLLRYPSISAACFYFSALDLPKAGLTQCPGYYHIRRTFSHLAPSSQCRLLGPTWLLSPFISIREAWDLPSTVAAWQAPAFSEDNPVWGTSRECFESPEGPSP